MDRLRCGGAWRSAVATSKCSLFYRNALTYGRLSDEKERYVALGFLGQKVDTFKDLLIKCINVISFNAEGSIDVYCFGLFDIKCHDDEMRSIIDTANLEDKQLSSQHLDLFVDTSLRGSQRQ
ncbi:hypothetical protein NDU88_004630 [Pleurodeles waltl]|uniref:Uncharacterized protein n=1 Tax=Pleurodeles waltl TaxID=8319 RepID=A0AAV7V1M1_PLEWA|nr:hypothetical protein NDU88_004630 [Pleurodeles waltl]